jgi:Winged helix DNA-binding domain
VRAWAMRGTVHLLDAGDAAWMLPLFEPGAIAFSRRRLPQLGMDAAIVDRAVRTIERALRPGEPLSRGELVERLAARGMELNVHTRVHVFRLAVSEGVACFGPDAGGEPCLVAPEAWLGRPPRHDRGAALAELARRYFAAFGPATEADYAGWAGLPLRDLRDGLGAIGGELREVEAVKGGVAWTLGAGPRRARSPVVRLLPGWDTYTMGYRDRDFLAPPHLWKRVLPGGGVIKPTIVVDGRVVGVWRSERKGGRVVVGVEPFERFDSATKTAIAADVADLGRFEALAAELAT